MRCTFYHRFAQTDSDGMRRDTVPTVVHGIATAVQSFTLARTAETEPQKQRRRGHCMLALALEHKGKLGKAIMPTRQLFTPGHKV